METTSHVYCPVTAYQTRIIRLHGANDTPESPLVCTLYVADILHPSFEGLGIRSCSGDKDQLVEYDALSYTWGAQQSSEHIVCNDTSLPVTDNLFEALKALRRPDGDRYIWVDAICINQNDSTEKATQVRNMLMIYQKASKVVAWLGASDEYLNDVLAASASIDEKSTFDKDRFERIHAGMQSLYSRPWFLRIWVQQEIFAARELRLQCGYREFTWSTLLSRPNLLSTLPHLQIHKYAMEKRNARRPPKEAKAQLNTISRLVELHTTHLRCFERFRKWGSSQPDLIDILLDTGVLHATDVRDHVYGVLGITGFPAKPMSIEGWTVNRHLKVYIPIDYTAEWNAILCAVTWAAVMEGGLALIAKFKVFEKHTTDSTLPSWVIDWRTTAKLTRRCFSQGKDHEGLTIKLDNPWDMRILDPHKGSKSLGKSVRIPAPATHERFVADNKKGTRHFTKLILRGAIDPGFYIDGNNDVWERRSLLKDKRLWHLPLKAKPQDIFVFMTGFRGVSHKSSMLGVRLEDNDDTATRYTSGGIWLLRPVGNDEFKLLTCLSWVPSDWRPLYDHWEWHTPQSSMWNRYRRLSQDLGESFVDYSPPMHKGKLTGLRKFVIV